MDPNQEPPHPGVVRYKQTIRVHSRRFRELERPQPGSDPSQEMVADSVGLVCWSSGKFKNFTSRHVLRLIIYHYQNRNDYLNVVLP